MALYIVYSDLERNQLSKIILRKVGRKTQQNIYYSNKKHLRKYHVKYDIPLKVLIANVDAHIFRKSDLTEAYYQIFIHDSNVDMQYR